jgi:tetratricopeptide (TPR) repeat protein
MFLLAINEQGNFNFSYVNPAGLGKKLLKARGFMESGNFAEALSLYAALVKYYPQGGGEYGRAAAQSGDFALADRIWENVRKYEPKNAGVLAGLAGEYGKIGLHTKSRVLFSEAANLEPRNLDSQIKLAWLLARTNSVEDARPVVKRCLELNARDEQARFLAAHLDRRENKFADAERQFRELLASSARLPHVRYSCHSELANILDRTERFDDAMTVLEQGKQFARQGFNLKAQRKAFYEQHDREVRAVISLPKNTLQTWEKTFPPRLRTEVAPVSFLSGSSRSGTTLLERILDAHPGVAACDESLVFKKIQPLVDITAASIPAPRLNAVRQLYVKSLTTVLGLPEQGRLLLDKNPSRTIWLAAFLRVFPELRVLIGLRDPRDIMISLYFQDHPNTNYLTFEELAKHYRGVMDVWLAVREWEGLAWLETRYEDVVADLHKEGGRVTKFLGLEWHENQERFHEKNREKPILSTNYTDVTKPVYKRSVGRWRVYEKQLASALPLLEPYCKRFGYE